MFKSLCSFVIISFLVVDPIVEDRQNREIIWIGNWAFACDFRGNDLSNIQIRGEDCGDRCAQTSGCDRSMVCGVVNDSPIVPDFVSDLGEKLYGVLATRHGAYEVGACALTSGNYAIVNPVALGSIDSLKYLKFRPELCGQILQVDCGHGSLDIIITNSNYGGGLDLYGSTWAKLTNNKPPGETSRSVQLTSRNAFTFDGPRCFYKPGTDFNNPYYHNVGLLNTKGRRVIRATIDNRSGKHRSDNPYYAFDFGPIDGNKQIVFTLDNGSTETVYLKDCEYQQDAQLWS